MKKSILFSALLLSAFSMSAADFIYGVSNDEFAGYGTQTAGYNYSAAIEVPENIAASMTGSTVTEISVGFHSGLSKAATIFLTYDLNGTPFYEQSVKGLKAGKYNSYELTTPYIIEGKKFYIGYTYHASSTSGFPIGFDESAGNGNEAFCYLKDWADNGTGSWRSASELGVLALRATVSGDNLPSLGALPKGIQLPEGVSPGKEFSYTITVKNLSTSPLNNIEVSTVADGKTMESRQIELDEALEAGGETTVSATAISDHDTMELLVKSFITKANGEANPWSSFAAEGTNICSDFVFPRMVVAEEFTGTDCGYCPRGIYSLEILSENHPDTFIPIEVHNYSTSDPMYCSSYNSWTSRWGHGAPTTVLNRKTSFSPDPSTIENMYKAQAGLVRYSVTPEVTYADDSYTTLNIKTSTKFGVAYNNHNMGLAFVVIQNNMGPYQQANNYSGSKDNMGGWESRPGRAPWIYNDVARTIYDWQGRAGTLPSKIEQGETCVYETTINIAAPKDRVHADTQIVVLLIDRNSGEILNAGKAPITDAKIIGGSGVANISNDSAAVSVIAGGIAVEGEFEAADIYTLDGIRMATLRSEGSVNLPAGIYMVRTVVGSKASATKVMVK